MTTTDEAIIKYLHGRKPTASGSEAAVILSEVIVDRLNGRLTLIPNSETDKQKLILISDGLFGTTDTKAVVRKQARFVKTSDGSYIFVLVESANRDG